METENINNYSEMSIEDLEKLKIKFLSQRDNIENTIGEIINNIRAKNCKLVITLLENILIIKITHLI